jgi:hypothetical protein
MQKSQTATEYLFLNLSLVLILPPVESHFKGIDIYVNAQTADYGRSYY